MLFLILLFSVAFTARAKVQSGEEIARKIEIFNNGFKGETSEIEMILISAHGDRVTRRMKSETLETRGDGDKSILTFHWPADVKGTKLLTWSHKKSDDSQWMYLPSLRRVKRITTSSKASAFMGSEFAYEDLVSQETEKYKYKLLRSVKYKKRSVWVLEIISVEKNSSYSKQIAWVDKKYRLPLKIEYYDKKSALLKVAKFNNIRKYGRWYRPGSVTMTNKQTLKKSIFRWKQRKLRVKLQSKNFNSSALKNF